jgi:hypothetical protein
MVQRFFFGATVLLLRRMTRPLGTVLLSWKGKCILQWPTQRRSQLSPYGDVVGGMLAGIGKSPFREPTRVSHRMAGDMSGQHTRRGGRVEVV